MSCSRPGQREKIALTYKREGISAEDLWAAFIGKAEAGGFTKISECVGDNGTTRANFVNTAKVLLQISIDVRDDSTFEAAVVRGLG